MGARGGTKGDKAGKTVSRRASVSSDTPSKGDTTKSTKAKNSQADKTANNVVYSSCPCNASKKATSWELTCSRCPQKWHSECVNLKGIPETFVEHLEDWECPFCFVAPAVTNRHSQQLTAILLKLTELQQKNLDLEEAMASNRGKIESVAADVEIIRGQPDIKPCLETIGTHIQHQLINEAEILKKLAEKPHLGTAPPPRTEPEAAPTIEFVEEPLENHGFIPIQQCQQDFVEPEKAPSLVAFLEKAPFRQEGGHSVCTYGVPYKYTGARSANKEKETPIPPDLKPLMDSINNICREKKYPLVNSCLVNRYEGPSAHLPRHSDDEISIHPESSIFTVSMGQSCKLTFSDKRSGVESKLTCNDRSLYIMSFKSQSFFDHRMDEGAIEEGVRYSLTFRSLDWKNKNSTCVIGSSNTCLLRFGKSGFGELMPGRQFYTPHLQDIDPKAACGYQHVVVMCGINDVRKPEVEGVKAVEGIYCELKNKICQIKSLNENASIYICPLLPTKLPVVNKKAMHYNKLIMTDLLSSSLGVTFVNGFDSFLDHSGLLAQELSKKFDRHNKPDKLHLNWRGAAMLAGMIKSTVFCRINGGVDKRPAKKVNGELYSSVTKRGVMTGGRRS